MVDSYYKHTRTESVKLPYSFRCEQCMNDSGPRVVTVTGSAYETSRLSKELSDKKEQKLRRDAHKDLVRTLKNMQKDALEKQRIDTIFGDECPHCHKHQSWGISGMKREMFIMPISFIIFGLFMGGCGLVAKLDGDKDITTPIIVGMVAAGVIAAIISLIWNIIKINQKTPKIDTGVQKNLPVIEWGAVQYLLDEP